MASLLLASSLVACASDEATEVEPPEILTDGAADSWAAPTPFGALHEDVWQRGEFDPTSRVRFPAWEFSLDGHASVTLFTRTAPSDEEQLYGAQLFLYKRRDAGTWQRIARSPEWHTYGTLIKSLEAGEYRVVATARFVDAEGEFLLNRSCIGEGCANGAQCLLREDYNQLWGVHRGALRDLSRFELTAASNLSAVMEAQIVAAVNESTHEVTTVTEAFAAVDGEVVNYHRFWDDLTSRELVALEYGAGDNSYGAFFAADSSTVAAGIHDGEIANCQIAPRACVFGQRMYEAEHMPSMFKGAERTLTSPAGVDAVTAQQLVKLMEVTTLADAFAGVEEFHVVEYWLDEGRGRSFVEIRYHAGDTPVGAFFRAGSDQIVAEISDGDLYNCTEVYE